MYAAVRHLRCGLLLALAVLAAGCATVPRFAGQNPADPLEGLNRQIFKFNDRVDRAILKPVAEGYVKVVPEPARDCVSNFFANLGDVPTAINNLLQAKPVEAVSDLSRFTINTTVGLAGCFDVATRMGLFKNSEDFGQTLGSWGVGPGWFVVLPLLGPSNARDVIGRVVDARTDPIAQVDDDGTRTGLYVLGAIDLRASLLQASRLFDGAAIDKYLFARDAYLQRRRNQVYDGNPPRLPESEEPNGNGALPSKSFDQPPAEATR